MSQAGFLLVLCIGALAQASKAAKIPCPKNLKAVSPFNSTTLEGVWYQQQKLGPTAENQGRCVGAKYTLQRDGSIEVTVAQIDPKTKKPAPITGNVKISDPMNQGNVIGTFPKRDPISYVIMKVDSKNYMVAFSCSSGFSEVWIKTRVKHPKSLDAAYAVLKDYPTLTKDAFVPTDQKDCAPMVWKV